MRGISIPFNLQEKGVFEIQDFTSICSQDKWKRKQEQRQEVNRKSKNNSYLSCNNNEPTSVLHMRRSQSPPTSASTLSSSFNNTTNTDNAPTILREAVAPLLNNERKDEWATELQPIQSGLEVITAGGGRCGLGFEDWESMLSDSSQEHSILRWITGDVDDTTFGLKQLLQSGGNGNGNGHSSLVDFDVNAGCGMGIVNQASNLESVGVGGDFVSGNVIPTGVPNLGAFSGSGFLSNNNGSGKIGSSGLVNHIVISGVGLNSSNNNYNIENAVFGSTAGNNMPLAPASLPPGVIYEQSQNFVETPEEKPQILNPQILMNHQQAQAQNHQNPDFLLPLGAYPQQQEHHRHHPHLLQPQPKRHNSGGSLDLSSHHVPKPPFSDPGHEFLLRNHQQQTRFSQNMQFLPQHLHQKNLMVAAKQRVLVPGSEEISRQQHALLDQLYKAAELVGTGNFSHAQGILARLNHQLTPVGKPLQRAAFYFKETLQLLLMNNPVTNPPSRGPTPFDVIFKMGAFKVFSEVSPLIQFVNFTCNQAILEALDDADRIHIVDFDIGFGAQWASFMQELPMRSNRGTPSLKITAFASPSTHHHVELGLMRENLAQFANEIGVSFELDVLNFDFLDEISYTLPILRSSENEALAVNFPIWSAANQPSALPSLLRFVRQLSPKIVVSPDTGCDRSDLPFPEHILHALQSYINLLESLDAVNVSSDALNKIERFLLQPRIESTVLGGLRAPNRMPLWKTLFASAGFSPVTFSNFTETLAECLVKRTPVRGFHVEKRQASFVLCWQCRELISASAWRC